MGRGGVVRENLDRCVCVPRFLKPLPNWSQQQNVIRYAINYKTLKLKHYFREFVYRAR